MILSEHERRWAEIRFYQYCVNVYAIRHKTIDIVEYTDCEKAYRRNAQRHILSIDPT